MHNSETYSRVKSNHKSVVTIRGVLGGNQRNSVLSPAAGDRLALNSNAAKDLASQSRDKRGIKVALVGAVHPERASVRLLLDAHTPVSGVGETGRLGRLGGNAHRSGQCRRKARRDIEKRESRIDSGPAIERNGESSRVLESAVANQLGIDTAIARVVDVLGLVSTATKVGDVP